MDNVNDQNQLQQQQAETASSSSSSSAEAAKFSKGQRIFAKDEASGILYEALVRRAMLGVARQKQQHLASPSQEDKRTNDDDDEEEKEEWHYFVHYMGWNCKWDRWCSEQSLYEVTEKTRALAKNIQVAVREAKKKHGSRSAQVMVELAQRLKQLEQEQRLEEKRQELAKQGIAMQEQDEQEFLNEPKEKPTKYNKRYFAKELELRAQDLQGKRRQSHAEKLILPFALKKIVVEEWEVIAQCGMLPTLPAQVTVKTMLDRYLASVTKVPAQAKSHDLPPAPPLPPLVVQQDDNVNDAAHDTVAAAVATAQCTRDHGETMEPNLCDKKLKDGAAESKEVIGPTETSVQVKDEAVQKQEQEWQEMVDGIALLFDQAVGSQRLLYRQELPLFKWIQQEDDLVKLRYCEIFGCEYLLRLFLRLPALLADHLSDAETRPIFAKLHDLVRFLEQHQDSLFSQAYQNVVPEQEVRRKRSAAEAGVSSATNRKNAKRGRSIPRSKTAQDDDTNEKDRHKSAEISTVHPAAGQQRTEETTQN